MFSVSFSGNLDTGLVDTVNVSIFSEVTRISNFLNYDLSAYEIAVQKNEQTITQLSQAIGDIRQKIDYFIPHEQIFLNYKSSSMDVLQKENMTWLFAGASSDVYDIPCANSTVYRKVEGEEIFSPFLEVKSK